MKILLAVPIGVIIWTTLIACANDIPNSASTSEIVDEIENSGLAAKEATLKIEFSNDTGEYIRSGVIVGDGHFAVTYAPETSDGSTEAEVTHVRSKAMTTGSIIYIDEIFGLALIRLTDDLGTSVVISQNIPNLGEKLVIGDFLPIEGEDLAITRNSTLAGFELDGLILKFGGIVGSGHIGGPVLNEKGQLVGILTQGINAVESGSVMSLETFKYGLAEELVRYNEAPNGNASSFELGLIGIPAHVIKPSNWNILSGFGYFDMRAPEQSDRSERQSPNGYKVVGITNVDTTSEETSEEVLNRAITEFGDAFKRVPEFAIPDQYGFDKCALLMTMEEYSQTAFQRRGHVIPGGWVSHPGIYTGLCTGIGKDQRVIVFAESHDVDDIVNGDGLFKQIALVK